MKNLKKVLALVLVVAMMASFVVSASASVTDIDSVTYTEAVEVLTGMGVIGGYADGSFRPTNNVTRGAFAKMVAFVMNSGKDAAAYYANNAVLAFSDVAADGATTPSVGYVVTKGYVDGYADGTFRPGNSVSGLAAAKILLGALGITGEYTGAGWQNNVLNAAEAAGLLEGLETVDLTAALNREQAAQMIWNAINYSAKGATVEYVVSVDGVQVYQGTDALTALALQAAGGSLSTDVTTTDSLGYVKFGLKETTKVDDFGRKSVAYTNGKDGAAEVVYASFAPTAVLEYTTATTTGKIAAALGCTLTTDTVSLTVITNGAKADPVSATKLSEASIGDQGTLTQVYKTGKNSYDVVVVDTYVHEFTGEGDITKAVAATAKDDAKPAYITIDGLTKETDAFVKGDVVLYTKTATKLVNVVKANSVSGSITAVGAAGAYVRVDGVQYVEAAKSEVKADLLKLSADVNTYYVDSYGNLIYAVAGEVIDDVETNYIYVLATKAVAAETKAVAGENLFTGSSATTPAVAQAQVIDLSTGVISVVDLAIVQDTDGSYCYATKLGTAGAEVKNASAEVNAIWAYAQMADGSIVLVEAAEMKAVELAKATATIGVDGLYANSTTTVTVVETTANAKGAVVSASVTNYKGIANFPALKDSALVVADKNGLVSSIVVVKAAEAPATTVNYAVYAGEGETTIVNGSAVTKHSFYVGGEVVEYYSELTLTKNAVYDITVKNGVVTAASVVELTEKATVSAIDATFIVVDGKVVYLADSVTVYDATNKYAVAELAVKDEIQYHTNAKGAIDLIVVVG